MTPKRIQRKRSKGWRRTEGAVYIGRPSMWGNPYNTTASLLQQTAASLFKFWLQGHYPETLPKQRERILANLHKLKGKDLACWCKEGTPCHGDILLEMANQPTKPQ